MYVEGFKKFKLHYKSLLSQNHQSTYQSCHESCKAYYITIMLSILIVFGCFNVDKTTISSITPTWENEDIFSIFGTSSKTKREFVN